VYFKPEQYYNKTYGGAEWKKKNQQSYQLNFTEES
jgi:hypothetical protein